MSMSLEEDRLVALLSQWLARHVDNATLLAALETANGDELSGGQRQAVGELIAELRSRNGRGELEKVARETLEALVLGG